MGSLVAFDAPSASPMDKADACAAVRVTSSTWLELFFVSKLVSLRPPKSGMRNILKEGALVAHIDSRWYHIALCYLQPRRPTFVRMELAPRPVWNMMCVVPVLTHDKRLECLSEIDAVEEWDKEGTLTCRLFRFVAFNRAISPYYPTARLTIEPLDTLSGDNPFTFWQGRVFEEEKAAGKQRAQERAAARRALRLEQPHPRGPRSSNPLFTAERVVPRPPQGRSEMLALPPVPEDAETRSPRDEPEPLIVDGDDTLEADLAAAFEAVEWGYDDDDDDAKEHDGVVEDVHAALLGSASEPPAPSEEPCLNQSSGRVLSLFLI